MNKKIKIIDLFNKRVRKEQMPYKIKYGGEEYQLEDFMYINIETKKSFGEDFDLELCLLNEVEILEDNTEEIEEISLLKDQLEYVKSEYEETIEQQQKEIEELKNTETYKIAIIDKDKYVSKDKIREIIEGDYTNLWKILEIEKMLEE